MNVLRLCVEPVGIPPIQFIVGDLVWWLIVGIVVLVVIGSRFVESEIAFDAIHLSMIQGMAKTLPSLSIILETPLLLLLASIEGVPRST